MPKPGPGPVSRDLLEALEEPSLPILVDGAWRSSHSGETAPTAWTPKGLPRGRARLR